MRRSTGRKKHSTREADFDDAARLLLDENGNPREMTPDTAAQLRRIGHRGQLRELEDLVHQALHRSTKR